MPNYFDPSQMASPQQPDLSLLGNAQPNISFGTRLANAARPLLGNQDLALALLANSGYSPQKRSFGEIFGQSALQANQMKSQREQDDLMRRYREAQLSQIGAQPTAVMGPNGQPVYVAERDAIGKQPLLKSNGNDGMGQYNPRDYTPDSWARFVQSKDPSGLVRYESPRAEFKPSFNSVERTLPDGSTQKGTFDKGTGIYDWNGAIVPPGVKPEVDAAGRARGEASGAQDAKAPAQASFNRALGNMRMSIVQTPQGRIAGPLGSLNAYGDKKLFNSRMQQLSTELRTVFRIAGEGTLSDQEQQQYGLQLPSTDNPPEVNEQILQDLEGRVSDRQSTPIGNSSPKPAGVPATSKRRKFNPATGKIE